MLKKNRIFFKFLTVSLLTSHKGVEKVIHNCIRAVKNTRISMGGMNPFQSMGKVSIIVLSTKGGGGRTHKKNPTCTSCR